MFYKSLTYKEILLIIFLLTIFIKLSHSSEIMDEHDNMFKIFIFMYFNCNSNFFNSSLNKITTSIYFILVLNDKYLIISINKSYFAL